MAIVQGWTVNCLGHKSVSYTHLGVLKEADEQHFVVTIQKKVKEEGAKRPKLVAVSYTHLW